MGHANATGFDYVQGTVKPRNDNVVVRLIPHEKMTASGIHLPDNRKRRTLEATPAVVVAVGDGPAYSRMCGECGQPRDPFHVEVKPGDTVYMERPNCGEVMHTADGEHRIVRYAELVAVVERTGPDGVCESPREFGL